MKKRINLLTTVLFVSLLFGFAVAFLILPDVSFSEQENRSLRTFPDFSFERLADGSFSDAINDYFADQFPIRDALVGLKGSMEIALGKGENNGVLLGKGGQLAKRLFEIRRADGSLISDLDAFDMEQIRQAAEGLRRAENNLSVPFTVLLTGRTIDVAASAFDYPVSESDALWQAITSSLADDISAVETVPLFREAYENGEYVYFKTDHHWTTLGAYYAYAELMKEMGMEAEILPIERFERQTVSDSFYGTAWSEAGMKFVKPDSVELWYLGNENEFTVTADGKELDGFYSLSYLEKKDHYSVFLDGTHDVVTVTKQGDGDRPTLLLLKDSFANAMAPFLAQHFDLVLLNLSSTRTDFTNVTERAAEYGADRVLLLYTVENLVTAGKLNRLH